jgi:hypothetical protein
MSLGEPQEAQLAGHLTRAAEHLRTDRMADAQGEIEAALALSPGDVRARNLLGLLHFRAARFPEAQGVYQELLRDRPTDTSLRLNLGLVELRMGNHAQAVEHLQLVVEAEPDNVRAQGYYGLALLRAGQLLLARQVLSRAGQDDLVRQVDQLLAQQQDRQRPEDAAPPAPDRPERPERQGRPSAPQRPQDRQRPAPREDTPPSGETPLPTPAPGLRGRVAQPILPGQEQGAELDFEARHTLSEARRAVSAGARALDGEQPFLPAESLGEPPPAGPWQAAPASHGLPVPPSSISPLRPIPLPQERSTPPPNLSSPAQGAQPLQVFVRKRELAPPMEGSFGVTPDGLLVLRVAGHLPTRSIGVVISTGELSFQPLARRARGRTLDETFGDGPAGLFRAEGTGMMIISPRGGHFAPIALSEESIYLRESATFAFEEGLHWENGRIPGAGPSAALGHLGLPDHLSRVVQFRGSGQIVLHTERPVFTVRLPAGQSCYIEVEQLIGWTGKVIPGLLTEGGVPTPYVACSGEGFLLVEPPPREGNPPMEPAQPVDPTQPAQPIPPPSSISIDLSG